MKLSTKLFLTLLALTAAMLLLAMGLARYSFQQGFLEFISGMENARLQSISQQLVEQYQSNDEQWTWLQEQGLDRVAQTGIASSRPRPKPDGFPQSRKPPKGENAIHGPKGPPRNRPTEPPPPNMRQSPNFAKGPATAVFDQDGRFISGTDKSDIERALFVVPLYSNNRKIGELRSWPNVEGSSELSGLFARQQFWSSISIVIFCVLLAGALSWLLARKLLVPIHQLRNAIASLNAGKYGQEISSSRSDELGTLMANVDSLSQTLDKNRSAKNRMFADISHELRTPLTVLSGEIDLLKAGIRPFNNENLLSLEQESNRLCHLVDDLYQLSLSDLGGLKYTFVRNNFSDCLLKNVDVFIQRALQQGIELKTKIAPNICLSFDEKRIEQLIANLMMNAISYTDSPGIIDVKLIADDSSIILSVSDSAPSVSIGQCERLFDPLYRMDVARTRRESGAGLGLAIAKNIVTAHHGTIEASPSSFCGLCMLLTFPKTSTQ